jgi:hypothetical protein
MKIPKSFQLAGFKWLVKHQPSLNNLGECHSSKGLIFLRDEQTESAKQQAFCHELVHAILFSMGDSGPHDEKFVDGFAYLLHQYMVTNK